MEDPIDDIKRTIRIAKAIEDDIHEYKSFDVEAAYIKNRKRLNADRKRRSLTYYMLRIAAILLLPLIISTGILSYLYIQQSKQIDRISYVEAFSAPGIITKIQLPDSSFVWLNAGSSLRYPSRFKGQNRLVYLCGEGYFDVQADKKHPFYVSLNNGIQVKAHGTKFNVNAYEEDSAIKTSLETGLVDIMAGDQVVLLKPDEQLLYDKNTKKLTVRLIHIEEETAWKDGRLVFRNTTLEEVLKQLSRKYNIDIFLHKESQKEYKFRATFSSENITQILNYLSMAAPIRWSFADVKQQQDLTYPRQRIDVWLK
ncbi:FecR family protein [Parabacteroides sp. Marseille-P3160]|uniref:FecR family protein n=1 Tax=Parabacteroides sp. Marseille-P3160 TaxID=1917887 RepID=UPI0009BB8D15|nr:FecR family protein [Parabacteroides sp. Marseille-P3160]